MRKSSPIVGLLVAFGGGVLFASLSLGALTYVYYDGVQAEADDLGQIEQSNTLRYLILFLARPEQDFRCDIIGYARIKERILRKLEPDGSVAGIADDAVASALATFDAKFPVEEYEECERTYGWRAFDSDEDAST